MIIDDDYILKNFLDKNGNPNKRKLGKDLLDNDVYTYLTTRFASFCTLSEVVWRIKNKIENLPKCKNCGKELKFYRISKPFLTYCSNKCKNSDVNHINKVKDTCKLHYGVEVPIQNEILQNKIHQTKYEKYNNLNNYQKISKSIFNKYGVKCTFSDILFREKGKQTCLKKYGVENYGMLKEHKQKLTSEYVINKRIETQRNNGTLNSSKTECEIFNLLQTKFLDVIHHYKDKKRYPFVCDFYIPSLDLFIEYQGSMFHNKHPYLGTEEDLKEVEEIKQKSENRKQITGKQKTRYDSLVETWTVRDPLKREIAKKNELNYLEFFTFDEFIDWLNEQ